MWTDETRLRHDRSAMRYTHDRTDEERAEVEFVIPPAQRGGNKRSVGFRKVVNGLMYILGTGCQWRDILKDLPPRSTIHGHLDRWSCDGTVDDIHYALNIVRGWRAQIPRQSRGVLNARLPPPNPESVRANLAICADGDQMATWMEVAVDKCMSREPAPTTLDKSQR
jgi:transposase